MLIVYLPQPGSGSIQLLEREVAVLKRVNHPNIIQLEEVFETSKVRLISMYKFSMNHILVDFCQQKKHNLFSVQLIAWNVFPL